jgi:hypothetical protein
VLQPACVWGYISEIFNLRKHWGTKWSNCCTDSFCYL